MFKTIQGKSLGDKSVQIRTYLNLWSGLAAVKDFGS